MSPSQLYLVTSCETAEEAWGVLRDHFERQCLANKLFLKKTYFRMEMKEGSSITTHLKRMKELTDQLAAVGAPISEEDQVMTLLGSLPEKYSGLVTALEARGEEGVTLAFVQQALVHEGQKQSSCKAGVRELDGPALVAGELKGMSSRKEVVAPSAEGSSTWGKKCYRCGGVGHLVRQCPSKPRKDVGHNKSEMCGRAEVMESGFVNEVVPL